MSVCSFLAIPSVYVRNYRLTFDAAGLGKFEFISGVHNELDRKPFMVMDYNTVRAIIIANLLDCGGLLTRFRPKEEQDIRAFYATNNRL